MKYLRIFGGASLILFSISAEAALIRITPTDVAVDEQLFTSPVPIDADGFRVTFHGGGAQTILNPLILILATPDGVTPTLDPSGVSNPNDLVVATELGGMDTSPPDGGLYGGSWNTVTGFAGIYDENTSKDATGGQISVYEFVGFNPDSNDSEHYQNWLGATEFSSWSIWIYAVEFTPLFSRGDWAQFDTTNLAVGSYVVGYGCTGLNTYGELCSNEGTTQGTPFTFAGVVVPEPGSLTLLGGGLLAMGLIRVRRRSRA